MVRNSGRSRRRRVAGQLRARRGELTTESIRQRYDSYLADHYLSVHVTIVSVTLAVAGLDAVALLTLSDPGRLQLLYWALWAASLLAAAVAYAGPMTSVIILPPRIPDAVDLFLPLLLGVCEFVMFSVLGSQAIWHVSANTILAGWWFAFAAFGLIAAGSVVRVVQIVRGSVYERRLDNTIRDYLAAERRDIVAASLIGCVATTVGTLHVAGDALSFTGNYVVTGLAIVMLSVGFINHRHTARILHAAIDVNVDSSSRSRSAQNGRSMRTPRQ